MNILIQNSKIKRHSIICSKELKAIASFLLDLNCHDFKVEQIIELLDNAGYWLIWSPQAQDIDFVVSRKSKYVDNILELKWVVRSDLLKK